MCLWGWMYNSLLSLNLYIPKELECNFIRGFGMSKPRINKLSIVMRQTAHPLDKAQNLSGYHVHDVEQEEGDGWLVVDFGPFRFWHGGGDVDDDPREYRQGDE